MSSTHQQIVSEGTAVSTAVQQGADAALPVKRRRGRPKGSKNKPKSKDGGSAPKRPPGTAKPKALKKQKLSSEAVDAILVACGVMGVYNVSNCLKAGILNGSVMLLNPENDTEKKFGLDQVLTERKCLGCGDLLKCRVKDVLYQPDCGGMDYEDGGLKATFRCGEEDCPGIYVTGICSGDFMFDSGKSHAHCTACPQFGKCIGDYREAHCFKCGGHFFAATGEKCYNCYPDGGSSDTDDDDNDY